MVKDMEIKATCRGARLSAQKARLLADQIRGRSIDYATQLLRFSPKKGAAIVKKILDSALANAEHNFGCDVEDLAILSVHVDKATSFKRSIARAKGRGNRIEKQNCHIQIVLGLG